MQTAATLKRNLEQFFGTERYHPHFGGTLLTDGAKYFADNAEAWWLIDILVTQPEITRNKGGVSVATLTSRQDNTGRLVVTDGDDNELYTREFSYTDCPVGTWVMYIVGGVILLPSEY